ncbi:LysR family transcriptional regulator [Nonomuraea sp. PA05]|uniref:LysR family transcriptional regulator n=1 Tax=Nonomuraea sp. PA05 TaxID=2604466 RepID=UPI0011D7C2C0|nr:LysR family transcriptional regulator [Nonomuraea sp. PA05]TYB60988.1 LysR family transcriptional regulator [Nonomuraea sp. PA05]
MEIDPRRLRILYEVARRGGVMRAAQALHLTSSAVSQQLAQLEREVGLPLIDRSQRSVSLTPAGRVLAGYAERVEEELTEARRELTRFTERLAGPVRIAAFATVIKHILVPALRELAVRHPKITPIVHEIYGQPALQELRLGSVDVLITEQDMGLPALSQPSLSTRLLFVDEYRIVLPPGWAELPATVDDLMRCPWVASVSSHAAGQALDRLAGLHGAEPRKVHFVTEFDSALALVAEGHGVAIVSTMALLNVPEGEVQVSDIREVGARRVDVVTRVGGTRSGEPDPVQAVVIEAIEEATAALGASLRGRLGEEEPVGGP